MVVIIAVIAIVSIILNIITFTSLCYVNFFSKRIRVKFGREFILMTNPIFLLVRHLNLCDLMYSTVALSTYWLDYYYGYFPLPASLCTLLSFVRKTVEYLDFATLSGISLYLAVRKKYHSKWLVLVVLICVWLFALSLTLPLLLLDRFGYDAVTGKCHIIVNSNHQQLYVESIGGGVPAVVMLFSYLVVYRRHKEDGKLGNTLNNTLIRLILGFLLFSLPHVVIKWTLDPFADAVMHCWFWLIFVVNPLIYIFYDEGLRVKEGMVLLVRDLRSGSGPKQEEEITSNSSDIWWIGLTRDEDEEDHRV